MNKLLLFNEKNEFISKEFSLEKRVVSYVRETKNIELEKNWIKLEFTISEEEVNVNIPIYSYNDGGGSESSIDSIIYLMIDGKYIDVSTLEIMEKDDYAVVYQLMYKFSESGVHSIWYVLDLYNGNYLRDGSFGMLHNLTKIVELPKRIKEIGWMCFTESNITELILPDSIDYINNFAFAGCTKLGKIILNEGLYSLYEEAFSDCISLTSIEIPSSVGYLDRWVFQRCYNLKSIKFLGETAPDYHKNLAYGIGFDGVMYYPYNCQSSYSNLINYLSGWKWKSLEFDASYTYVIDILSGGSSVNDVELKIGDTLFTFYETEGVYVATINIDKNKNMIDTIYINGEENGTFNYGRTNYTLMFGDNSSSDNVIRCEYNVSLIKNSESLYYGTAFTFNSLSINGKPSGNLEELTKNNDKIIIEYLKWGGYGTSLENDSFKSSAIENINIPNNITSIGDYTFSNCSGLTSFEIPSGVTSIGSSAFNYCTSLSNITIPNSVTSIGNSAFSYCSSLSSIIIPNSVESIGSYAFYDCSSLSSITIPNSVTSIGASAFYDCYFTLDSFVNNSSLDEVSNNYWGAIIVDEITNEGLYIKDNIIVNSNKNITYAVIPSYVTSIGTSAFTYCSSLSEITIPSGVTSIGTSAFQGCNSLSNITIPNSVTSIGASAFTYCFSLSEITIPESVTSIGNNVFRSCTSLSNITCLATTAPTIISNTFIYICSNGVLKVPSGSDYSGWMSTSSYYLGYYNWTIEYI